MHQKCKAGQTKNRLFTESFRGANKGLGEAPKAARERSMKARPTQSRRGVKGQLPLAGSRDSVPCGVWGNAPTVPRPTNSKEAANKGAGSEASLPVTLRVRRRAPKLLFAQESVKNQKRQANRLPFFNESSFFPPFPGCSAGVPAGKRCPWRRFSSCRRIG